MGNARKFLANYAILVTGDLVSRFMTFMATVCIARVLGRDLFGTLGFATAFAAYFELIARQGLDTFGIQAIAREPSRARHYADTLLGIRLFTSVVAFLALSLSAWRLARPEEARLLIIFSGLMFFTAACSPQWVFQALEEMKYAATARIIGTSVFALVVLLLLRRANQFLFLPLMQFVGESIAVAWLLWIFAKRFGFLRPQFNVAEWRSVLRESLPIGLEGACGVVLFNFDMLMLGFWRPVAEVGDYNAAYKCINFASAFVFLYGNNFLPVISRSRGNPDALRRTSDRLFQYSLLLAVPLAAGGSLLALDLIVLLFGSAYWAAARALRILIWIVPLVTCRVVYRNILLSHGLQRIMFWCTFCAMLINAGLNLLLIPKYGYVGSAVTMVITEVILLILMRWPVARRVVPLPFAPRVWKPVLATVAMILLLISCPGIHLALRIAVGVLVYVISAWSFGAFSIREIVKIFRERGLSLTGAV